MALLERASSGLHLFRRGTRPEPNFTARPPEGPPTPESHFSPAFLEAQARQFQLDARFSLLSPTGKPEGGFFGQEKDVAKVPTTEGPFVVKTLKPTSRFNLIYGLGYPAESIPPNKDTSDAKDRMVEDHVGKVADPEEVAEKVRLTHVIATTYLGEGGLLVPTATMVDLEGNVVQMQKYLPPAESVIQIPKHPREIQIEAQAKLRLFGTLQQRWGAMLRTPDFHQLPPDVQDYWKNFPPESGNGTNAYVLGAEKAVAIDY